jgi:hypothetical protein
LGLAPHANRPMNLRPGPVRTFTVCFDPAAPPAVSQQALADAVEFAKLPRAKTQIAAELTALTGRRYLRQEVYRWLHPDPEKRQEPQLTVGLLLVAAARLAKEKRRRRLEPDLTAAITTP